MATITGPKVQMPSTMSEMFEKDGDGKILGLKPQWAQFFNALQGVTYSASRSGASTSRPTSSMTWRYAGMPFFDTSLGKPIYLKTASSDVWVDATGSVV